jgi:hypothetical protein
MVLRRNVVVAADATANIDATGAASFAPGTRPLVVRGLAPDENLEPKIAYATGGLLGIDVGPQDVPVTVPDVTTAYATVPAALQIATDRYRATLLARTGRNAPQARAITFSLHADADVDLTLLPVLAIPKVTVAGTSPYVRLTTHVTALASVARHELRVSSTKGRQQQHDWVTTFDTDALAGSSDVNDTFPDLSTLTGWKNAWAIPTGLEASVTASAVEKAQVLGDGTSERTSSQTVKISP